MKQVIILTIIVGFVWCFATAEPSHEYFLDSLNPIRLLSDIGQVIGIVIAQSILGLIFGAILFVGRKLFGYYKDDAEPKKFTKNWLAGTKAAALVFLILSYAIYSTHAEWKKMKSNSVFFEDSHG